MISGNCLLNCNAIPFPITPTVLTVLTKASTSVYQYQSRFTTTCGPYFCEDNNSWTSSATLWIMASIIHLSRNAWTDQFREVSGQSRLGLIAILYDDHPVGVLELSRAAFQGFPPMAIRSRPAGMRTQNSRNIAATNLAIAATRL